MASSKFDPQTAISADNFRELFFSTRIMRRLRAKATARRCGQPIDGDPNTFWTAGDQKDAARKDQELTIAFPNAVQFSGIVVMPRQNHREHEGDVRDYAIQISDDGVNWRDLKRGSLLSTFDPQKIDLGRTATSKFIKFIALSGFGTDKATAIADLAVIYTGPKLPEDDSDVEYKRSKSASPDIDEGTNKETRNR